VLACRDAATNPVVRYACQSGLSMDQRRCDAKLGKKVGVGLSYGVSSGVCLDGGPWLVVLDARLYLI